MDFQKELCRVTQKKFTGLNWLNFIQFRLSPLVLCLQSSDRAKIFEICNKKLKQLLLYVNSVLIQIAFISWPK